VASTLQTLVLTALAILPGALYTWSFEQRVGLWGATAADRAQRFLGASAFFLALELPLLYYLVYRTVIVTGDISHGRDVQWWVWLAPVAYVLLPVAFGNFVGQAARARRPWTRILTGPTPAPRAWDHLFAKDDLYGFIRLRLKDGPWILGSWGHAQKLGLDSYASGYPEIQDLFISDIVESDDEGQFVVDEGGEAVHTGRSLLLRWDEVAYAEFIPD
jgi:hypothetical protein